MNHVQIINNLIKNNQYESYLEIGVDNKVCFNNIECSTKISVDPAINNHYYDFNMTSNDFFKINNRTFDIIFIDGLHLAEQVDLDIENSLSILNKDGTIIIHDTNPPAEYCTTETHNQRDWCGTVWKSIFKLRKTRSDLIIMTYPQDYGITILTRGESDLLLLDNEYYSYNIFDKHRNAILNFIK